MIIQMSIIYFDGICKQGHLQIRTDTLGHLTITPVLAREHGYDFDADPTKVRYNYIPLTVNPILTRKLHVVTCEPDHQIGNTQHIHRSSETTTIYQAMLSSHEEPWERSTYSSDYYTTTSTTGLPNRDQYL